MASWKPREHEPLERIVVTLPPEKMKAVLAEIAKILYNHFSQSDFIAPSSTTQATNETQPQGSNHLEVL